MRGRHKTRVVKSLHYRDWLRVAVPLLAHGLPRFDGPVRVSLVIHRGKGWRTGRDLSNCFKGVEDALVLAGRIPDDSEHYVREIAMAFGDPVPTACCVVFISGAAGARAALATNSGDSEVGNATA